MSAEKKKEAQQQAYVEIYSQILEKAPDSKAAACIQQRLKLEQSPLHLELDNYVSANSTAAANASTDTQQTATTQSITKL